MRLHRLILLALAVLGLSLPAAAQTVTAYVNPAGTGPQLVDATHPLPVTGSFSATTTTFAPTGQATVSATTTTSRVALASVGPTALVTNNGAVTAYINFGDVTVTATTSSYPVNAGQSIAFNVGSNTYIAGITGSSTASIAVTTGTGLPAIAGGGTSGGGGGAITAANASFAGGWSVDFGALADAACATDNGNCGLIALLKRDNQRLTSLLTALGTPFQAGGSIGNTTFAVTNAGTFAVQNTAATPAGSNPIGSVSGFESGPIQATATPANSSHAAGTSVGGLFTLSVARINGGSGIITNFSFTSSGASTLAYTVRVWDKSPAATTCTDNSAFAGSLADDANLITPPFTITPFTPVAVTGDANSYAGLSQLSWDYANADSSPGKNLYVCVVTSATDTVDQNKAVYVKMSGPQN